MQECEILAQAILEDISERIADMHDDAPEQEEITKAVAIVAMSIFESAGVKEVSSGDVTLTITGC